MPIPRLHRFVADAIELCDPERVMVQDDSPEGMLDTRRLFFLKFWGYISPLVLAAG
ncbi:MAG: hypothetical protein KKG09_00135 [Verrucomicrobia bacterium]|nr:hypothetical protein [Verrucomicrobiota bacterium]MBU4292214.1 hypothetical protein [Verrucomicrobiota bacterium]MBU4496399.1 hypothetical protein [Verrucomicrobiota bacterium]MCG2680435.1 hypothetical protein [Kiritimatiellia bacterium]